MTNVEPKNVLPPYETRKGTRVPLEHGGYGILRNGAIVGPYFCYANAEACAPTVGGIVVRWIDWTTQSTRQAKFLKRVLEAETPFSIPAIRQPIAS